MRVKWNSTYSRTNSCIVDGGSCDREYLEKEPTAMEAVTVMAAVSHRVMAAVSRTVITAVSRWRPAATATAATAGTSTAAATCSAGTSTSCEVRREG